MNVCELKPGTLFRVVGLEGEGLVELLRVSDGSCYVRSAKRTVRQGFETYKGDVVKPFEVPADGYNISRATPVILDHTSA